MVISKKKLILGALWVFFCILAALAIFPDLVLDKEGMHKQAIEYSLRTGAVISSLVGGLITYYLAKTPPQNRILAVASDAFSYAGDPVIKSLPHHINVVKTIVILNDFPSFKDADIMLSIAKRSAILANFRYVIVSSVNEVIATAENQSVIAVIVDENHYRNLYDIVHQKSVFAIFVKPGRDLTQSGAGYAIRMNIPVDSVSSADEFKLASHICEIHSLDTPRGIGFQGNWFTTYSLLCLSQDEELQVRGQYYYGGGELHGVCIVDEVHQLLILEFSWSQAKNAGATGSDSFGRGIFVIHAGHEFFEGYWYRKEDTTTAQPWTGSRVSRDVTDGLLASKTQPLKLSLADHGKGPIIRWQ